MKLDLTPEQQTIVQGFVRAGAYASEQEVIDEALSRLHEDLILADCDPDELRASVDESKAQFARGEGKPWNRKEFLAKMQAEESKAREEANASA